MKSYVILDPQHVYGVRLVEALRRDFGLAPVCVYSDSRAELRLRAQFPALRGAAAAGHYYLDQGSLDDLAAEIGSRHRVVAVVPYSEQAIVPGLELMRRLGLQWNAPATLARFRDKAALKAHIAARDPTLALGLATLVRTAEEVGGQPLPPRFVIKPVDGFGNANIGFFDRATCRVADIAAYLASRPGGRFILEEFFAGPEYAVNGQMDHLGEPHIIDVSRYERAADNGRPNLYHRTHHVRRQEPAFAPLVAYAARVMRATGLVRCPFHMEVILADEGPRLVEVGARLGGTHYALMSQDVHGGRLDVFALAAHYYASAQDYGTPAFDWDFYDRIHYLHLDGICRTPGRIAKVDGVQGVEAMPEFRGWVVKPRLGAALQRTVDLYTVPYSFHLASMTSHADLFAASEAAKSMIRINEGVQRWQRLGARGRQVSMAVGSRAHYFAERQLRRCRRRLSRLKASAAFL